MTDSNEPGSAVPEVRLGATRAEGGTREVSYVIGGERDLPFSGNRPGRLLVALEVCDDPRFSPPVVRDYVGDLANNPDEWARAAERTYGADLVRLNFTSTKQRGFDAFGEIAATTERVLAATTRPLIVEGSSEPELDSEVFRRCGEAGEGERLLLGTAEADRYRSVAAAALAYNHAVIAQSPIDINLAKQLNILLRETGIPRDRIVIDPYTGALGYGFEYSYSVMERIRLAALAGGCGPRDADDQRPRRHPLGPGGAGGRTGGAGCDGGRLGVLHRLLRHRRRCIDHLRPSSSDREATPGGSGGLNHGDEGARCLQTPPKDELQEVRAPYMSCLRDETRRREGGGRSLS